ncbi:hypothetical protein [Bryocella elongata]|uniref:hypothetical protein n=1 Tax=Bryocella elongata TaxID=863522 RepID=UPI000CDF0819|nr:hypothetical protein [Bryocella elongata]
MKAIKLAVLGVAIAAAALTATRFQNAQAQTSQAVPAAPQSSIVPPICAPGDPGCSSTLQ